MTDDADFTYPEVGGLRQFLATVIPMLTSAIVHMVLLLFLMMLTFVGTNNQEEVVLDAVVESEEPLELDTFEAIDFSDPSPELENDLTNVLQAEVLEISAPLSELEPVEVFSNKLEVVENIDSMLTSNALMQEIAGGGTGSLFGSAADGGGTGANGGNSGGGLVGRFFDLKQDRERKPLPYSGEFPDYIETINKLVDGGISDAVTQGYYEANTRLFLSQLLIPDVSANEAPRAFHVEGEVEPRGWLVHYSGIVIPPEEGEWRFVGFFDDMLIVYVNNRPVLDGSWVPMSPGGPLIRNEFGGPNVISNRTAYAGKWIDLKGPTKIDILIGETPGGRMGGLLMCQKRGQEYEKREDGTPILPLFAVSNAETLRVRLEPFARSYGLVAKPPIWKPIAKRGR